MCGHRQRFAIHPGKFSQALKSRVLIGAELCKRDWLNPWPMNSFPSPFSGRVSGCCLWAAFVNLQGWRCTAPLWSLSCRRSLVGVRVQHSPARAPVHTQLWPSSRRCTQHPPVWARDPLLEPPVPDPLAPVSDYCAASEHPVESAFSIHPSYLQGHLAIRVHAYGG